MGIIPSFRLCVTRWNVIGCCPPPYWQRTTRLGRHTLLLRRPKQWYTQSSSQLLSLSRENNTTTTTTTMSSHSTPKTHPDSLSSSSFAVPSPTWAIHQLALTTVHAPVSWMDYQRLSQLALLFVGPTSTSTTTNSSTTRSVVDPVVLQDLGNFMHMVQQIVVVSNTTSHDNDNDQSLTVADIYDVPRGILPSTTTTNTTSPLERLPVSFDFVQGKMTRIGGGHWYFAIPTKVERPKS